MSLTILSRFCSKDRKSLTAPFLVESNSRQWACASNGLRLIALPAETCPGVDVGSLSEQLAGMLPSLVPVGTVDLAVLAAFCGAPTTPWTPCVRCDGGMVECPECEGTSEINCECSCGDTHSRECSDCRGCGRVVCPSCNAFRKTGVRSRYLVIHETVFDGGLLAGALVDAERQAGTAEWCVYPAGKMHAVRGADWILLLAPVWVDSADFLTYPRFALGDLQQVGAA